MAAASDGGKPAPFKITTGKPNDAVQVRAEKDRATFTVTSPSGISQAVIERAEAKWPKAVVVRLRLKGLESFEARNGQVTLNASVSSQGGMPRVRLWKDGNEDAPLGAKSPYWMEVRTAGGDGKPAKGLPPRDGYFEMTLPAALFKDQPKSITLKWIDFYRS